MVRNEKMPNGQLGDKTAIVTGGGRGSCAGRRCHQRRGQPARGRLDHPRVRGTVHILVNNAGRGMRFVSERFFDTPTSFWQTDPAVWRMIIDTNVNGPFLMARAVVPHMLEQRWGRIVNISMNHETMRRPGFSPYGPSKAALESETIIWAQDLAGTANY
jgi:NAD(P)-dependent dehydrogenase (short-subunit alcohol dehydrogenase family)